MRWVNLPRSGQTSSRISSVIHPEGHKKPRATSEAQQASYVQLRSEVIIQQKLLSWVENLTKAHFTFTKKVLWDDTNISGKHHANSKAW